MFGVTAREISDGRLVYSERFKEDCPQLSDPVIERVLLLEKFAEHAIGKDVLLIHGSAICMDGRGYLFMAPSGTGKSTHTRLWRRAFGDRCFMVNDDKPFLRVNQDDVMVSGSPWSGKHRLDTNVSVPLRAIVILNRSEANRIARISPEAAFRCLYQQVYHPAQKTAQIKAL